MNISSTSSSTSLFNSVSHYQNKSSSGANGFDSALAALSDAIESGDQNSVQAAYNTLMENNPRSEHGDDPVGQFLASIENALANSDATALTAANETFAAQSSALSATQSGTSGVGPAAGEMPPPPPALSEEEQNAFSTLFESLASGDTDASQEALSSIQTLLQEKSQDATDTGYNPLQNTLAKIEESLNNGDSDSAQQYFQQILSNLPAGSLVSTAV